MNMLNDRSDSRCALIKHQHFICRKCGTIVDFAILYSALFASFHASRIFNGRLRPS